MVMMSFVQGRIKQLFLPSGNKTQLEIGLMVAYKSFIIKPARNTAAWMIFAAHSTVSMLHRGSQRHSQHNVTRGSCSLVTGDLWR